MMVKDVHIRVCKGLIKDCEGMFLSVNIKGCERVCGRMWAVLCGLLGPVRFNFIINQVDWVWLVYRWLCSCECERVR